MAPETALLLALNLFVTFVLLGVVSVLMWQRHSARHRDLQVDADRRYMDLIDQMRGLAPNGHDHTMTEHLHPEHALAVHDHPHDHEHVQHTHSLEAVSEHEDNGRKVVVKRCRNCATIFRDEG